MEDEIDIQHATEKQEHKGDGRVSQTEVLGKDISLEVELKCHQDQNKGVAANSREGRLFTPQQKSSGWDQLLDAIGFHQVFLAWFFFNPSTLAHSHIELL